ncbi:MAG: acyltransferase family protein [Methanobrevibacter sp.]|nr:acyltransferase family protein [Methanobrevibacter sp.]
MITETNEVKSRISTENFESSDKTQRIAKYDNLRGLAMTLVVFGHVLGSFFYFNFYIDIFNFIYIFHMPLLFFISGYFTKIGSNSSEKAFKRILIPYIIFAIINTGIMIAISLLMGKNLSEIQIFSPLLALWYLAVLFIIRLIFPILIKIKHIFWVSLIIALIAGLIAIHSHLDYLFCITLTMLPSFLLGYYYKNSTSKKLAYIFSFSKNKLIPLVLLIVLSIAIILVFSNVPYMFFMYKQSFAQLGLSNIYGIIIKLGTIIFGFMMIILLNNVISDKKNFLTKVGVNSLALYVLHNFLTHPVNLFLKTSFGLIIKNNIVLSSIFLIFVTIIIVFILSRDFVTNIVNKIINSISNFVLS